MRETQHVFQNSAKVNEKSGDKSGHAKNHTNFLLLITKVQNYFCKERAKLGNFFWRTFSGWFREDVGGGEMIKSEEVSL